MSKNSPPFQGGAGGGWIRPRNYFETRFKQQATTTETEKVEPSEFIIRARIPLLLKEGSGVVK